MVRLSRAVWIQLAILAAVTVIAGGVMAFGFVNVPALLGIGRYNVTLELPASGGLYPTSVVTYRGSEVGRVTSVDVTRDGVQAVLKLDSSTKIPSDVRAEVHSRSAVGEQFVQLIPATDDADVATLRAGDVIGVGQGRRSPPKSAACSTRPTGRCRRSRRTTCAPSSTRPIPPSAGWGRNCHASSTDRRRWRSTRAKTVDPITKLIDQSPPVLNSQVQTADSIETWANRMASITGQLKAQDTAFAGLLNQGGPALEEGRAFFDRVAPALPILLANMVSLGDIAVAYRNDIEQLLVLFPQGTAVMSSIILPNSNTKQDYKGVYLDFNLNLNLPPPCNTGFLPVRQQRSPSEQDAPSGPPASCTAGCRRTRTSMSVACATSRVRRCRASGRRPSRCAKATSSTSRSMTATTGRATPTRRCPARVCRSTRRASIRGCRHRRVRVRRSRLRDPRRLSRHRSRPCPTTRPPATTSARTASRYTQANLAHPGQQDVAVDAGPASLIREP